MQHTTSKARRELVWRYLNHLPCAEIPSPLELQMMDVSPVIKTLDLPVCERPLSGTGYDVFGVHWTHAPQASSYTPGQPPVYDDIEHWREQVRFPDLRHFPWEQFRRAAAAFDREKYLMAVVLFTGPFERATTLTNFEDCLVNLITEPEGFADLIGAIADYKIALIDQIWDCAQPDIFYLHDDWGTTKSTFMSPALWRQVIKPHTQRIYDAVHAHGALVVQHSCGRVETLVEDMVELGADAWDGQSECNDMDALRARYADRLVILDKPSREEILAASGGQLRLPNQSCRPYPEYPAFLFE